MKSFASVAVIVVFLGISLSGCGTVGGAVKGAGQDLSRAGEWLQNR